MTVILGIKIFVAIVLFFTFNPLLDELANLIITSGGVASEMLAGFFKATCGMGLIIGVLKTGK